VIVEVRGSREEAVRNWEAKSGRRGSRIEKVGGGRR
jgi:hypothetical protein